MDSGDDGAQGVDVEAGFGNTYFFWGGADDICVVFNRRDTKDGGTWDSRHIFAVDGATRTYLGGVYCQHHRGIASFKLPWASGGRLEVWESYNGEVRRAFDVLLTSGPQQRQAGTDDIVGAKLDLFLRQPNGPPGFHLSVIPSWNDFDDQTIRHLEFYHQQSEQLLVETVIGSAKWVESEGEPSVLWVFPAQSHFSGKRHIAHVRARRMTDKASENIVTAFQDVIFSEGCEIPAVELLFEGPLEDDLPYDGIVVFTVSHFYESASRLSETDEEIFGAFRDQVVQDLSKKGGGDAELDILFNQITRLSSLDILDNLPFLQRYEPQPAGSSAYTRALLALPWLAPGDRFGIIVRRPIRINAQASPGPEQNAFPDAVVFRYLVRGSVLENLGAENLKNDPLLRNLLNRGASLLSSTAGESVLSEYSEQRRLSDEARAGYTAALGLDNLGAQALRQRVASASAAQLHELLAGQRAARVPQLLNVNALDVFLLSPGLFRFAQLKVDWLKMLSRPPQSAVAMDGLFRAIWKLALPGAPPPNETWNEPAAIIRFLDFAQDFDVAAKCVERKLFPTVDVIDVRKIRRLLQTAQSHVTGIRKLGTEWLPLKLIETAASSIEDRKLADEGSTAAANDNVVTIWGDDAETRPADDEPTGTREELIDELLNCLPAGLSEDERRGAVELIENSDDVVLGKMVGQVKARLLKQTWPERAVRIISTLENWSGASEFSKWYRRSSPAPAAVAQFVAFNLQKWPREATGQLAELKRELGALLRRSLTDDPSGVMKVDSLVTYAEMLLYCRIARAIDESLIGFTRYPDQLPPEIVRGISTVRTLRQAFPHGANAAVTRLEQLFREMEGSGNRALARFAATNRLKISMPRLPKNPSDGPTAAAV